MGCFPSKQIRRSFGRVLPDIPTAYDPELLIFDSLLHDRTVEAIHPFADGVKIRSFSIDSVGDIPEYFLDTHREVVASVLKSKEEIWENKEVLNLVQMYLDSSLDTLNLFTSLQERLDRARNSHSILQSAIDLFKKDTPASYNLTFKKLKDFQAAGDPFSDDFLAHLEYVYQQQIATLNKLTEEKSRLDAKLKHIKAWRKVSSIIVIAAFVAVVILTVIAAVTAPPLLAGVAAAAALPLGSMPAWMSSIWNRLEMEKRGESGIVGAARDHTNLSRIELENIRAIVNRIDTDLESLLKISEFGVENQEEGLNSAIDEMKKKSKGLLKSIDTLEKRVVRSTGFVSWARTKVLKKLEKHEKSDLL